MNDKLAIFDPSRAEQHDDEIKELREENKKLARALQDANVRAQRAEEDTARALTALRRQLTPLYRALQAVFGELDAAGIGDDAQAATGPQTSAARPSPVWDAWKNRLSASCGKIIDALLIHGALNVEAIVVATGITRKQTIYDSMHAMKKAGIINKDSAGAYSLKQL